MTTSCPATAAPAQRRTGARLWPRGTVVTFLAVVAAWTLWAALSDQDKGQMAEASVSVGANGEAVGATPTRGAIIVTLRWGLTDHRHGRSEMLGPDSVSWDGFLSLDCGQITRVEPLAFELYDPDATTPIAQSDFVGDVVRAKAGEERVYWRSRTLAGWDGLRVTIAACRADGASSGGKQPASTLVVRTAQRDYTARLDWSANDFVALATARRGHRLEVHINAQQPARSLRGARITAATSFTSMAAAESPKTER